MITTYHGRWQVPDPAGRGAPTQVISGLCCRAAGEPADGSRGAPAQLVAVLAADDARRLVLEQDDSLLERDRAVLYDAVRRTSNAEGLTDELLPARSEPPARLADTAAWCWTHGPVWPASRRLFGMCNRCSTSTSPARPPPEGLPGLLRTATTARATTVGRLRVWVTACASP